MRQPDVVGGEVTSVRLESRVGFVQGQPVPRGFELRLSGLPSLNATHSRSLSARTFLRVCGQSFPSGSSSARSASARIFARVVSSPVTAPGGALAASDSAVPAIGTDAGWLGAHAVVGRRVAISTRLRRASGALFELTAGTGAFSAASILLRDGRPAIDATREECSTRAACSTTASAPGVTRARSRASTDREGCCSSAPTRCPA